MRRGTTPATQLSPGLQAVHSLGRVLTPSLPAGLRERGMERAGLDLRIVVGVCERNGRVVLGHAASDGRWCWVRLARPEIGH